MKKPINERFQELAGIKPLAELSPELKARAALGTRRQGRDQQAAKFGSSMDADAFGGKMHNPESALGAFTGKFLGNDRENPSEITSVDITNYGFTLRALTQSTDLNFDLQYMISKDSLKIYPTTTNDFFDYNKDKFFNRKDIGLFKQMIKIVNPESELANTHWASFKIEGSGIKKENRRELAESVLKLTKKLITKVKNK